MEEIKMPYLNDWLSHLKVYHNISEYTEKNYPIHLRKFFEFTNGRYNVNKITIEKFTKYLLEEKKEARSTINARLSALRSYFHFLYNEEIIDRKIANNIELIKEEPKEMKKLMSQKQVFKILDSITDVRDRALLETIYTTGIREGECSNLNIENIYFEDGLLSVIKGKGKKSRTIPISKTALKWLRAYIGARKSGPLFLNNRNGRLGERSIYNIVTKYFNFSPHELRHCFATHLIVKTGNIKGVSNMLGHSSIRMTEEIYTHINTEDLKNIYGDNMDR